MSKKRLKWDRPTVVAAILERQRTGRALRRFLVVREDSRLVRAAGRHFGNWSAALRSAGLDPRQVIGLRHWDAGAVIEAIQSRQLRGAPLNSLAVQRDDRCLFVAAARRLGGWSQALQAAGLDAAAVRRQRPDWNADTVVQGIRDLLARGRPVCAGLARPTSLLQSGYRLFGSWDAALRAAGVDPAHVRQKSKWSAARVVAEIQRRASAGLAVHAAAIQASQACLSYAAKKYLGSWDEALRQAGLSPEWVRKAAPALNQSAVTEAIRARAAKGLSLQPSKLHQPSLLSAAQRLFGSWRGALRAAGVNPADVIPRAPPWTRSRIVETIRRGAESGRLLKDWGVCAEGLRIASRRLFGSWHAAVRAAGFRPTNLLKRGPRPGSKRTRPPASERGVTRLEFGSRHPSRCGAAPALTAAATQETDNRRKING